MRDNRIKPIFIIGAGRSGTNILRDTLTSLPEFATWPCDEINLIFRHGNKEMPHDEFSSIQARPEVKKYIIRQFEKLKNKHPDKQIIEKTCANSLRVPFLNEIFPDAFFIHIIRNGYDVTYSAMQRWTSSIEVDYLLKKLKFVPVSDIPYYAFAFIRNRVKQMASSEKKMAQWGPVYQGMDQDLRTKSLPEIAALQWAACVKKASTDLSAISPDRVHTLHYDDFVQQPFEHIRTIVNKLGKAAVDEHIRNAVKDVRVGSIGKGKSKLGGTITKIQSTVDPVMTNYYDAATENR